MAAAKPEGKAAVKGVEKDLIDPALRKTADSEEYFEKIDQHLKKGRSYEIRVENGLEPRIERPVQSAEKSSQRRNEGDYFLQMELG